jgi:hypothetical protein
MNRLYLMLSCTLILDHDGVTEKKGRHVRRLFNVPTCIAISSSYTLIEEKRSKEKERRGELCILHDVHTNGGRSGPGMALKWNESRTVPKQAGRSFLSGPFLVQQAHFHQRVRHTPRSG